MKHREISNTIRELQRNQTNKTLNNGDVWALAVEHAIGRLLNAFIVTNHEDSLLLRTCAREANYSDLQIIIYDFSLPRLNIPPHMLPHARHPTTLSLLHSEIHTVLNVLVDMGNVERQVLVRDYDAGKAIVLLFVLFSIASLTKVS